MTTPREDLVAAIATIESAFQDVMDADRILQNDENDTDWYTGDLSAGSFMGGGEIGIRNGIACFRRALDISPGT